MEQIEDGVAPFCVVLVARRRVNVHSTWLANRLRVVAVNVNIAVRHGLAVIEGRSVSHDLEYTGVTPHPYLDRSVVRIGHVDAVDAVGALVDFRIERTDSNCPNTVVALRHRVFAAREFRSENHFGSFGSTEPERDVAIGAHLGRNDALGPLSRALTESVGG